MSSLWNSRARLAALLSYNFIVGVRGSEKVRQNHCFIVVVVHTKAHTKPTSRFCRSFSSRSALATKLS